MPIYPVKGVKKDGLQKYNVRVNYTDANGRARQLTRTAYGKEAATDLEHKLTAEQKGTADIPAKKMTVQKLFDEYVVDKQYRVRQASLEKCKHTMELYILPTFKDIRIDRLNTALLQEWKQALEQRVTAKGKKEKLSLRTKQHIYDNFNAMLNYAFKMEYLPKNPLKVVGNFVDVSSVKKEMQYYTAQEFRSFIGAAKQFAEVRETTHKDLSEWDYYVFFNIAFYTGLRKGEIHAIKWSDLTATHLSVKRSIKQIRKGEDRETPPKNKSSFRTLQMPLPLLHVLDEHMKRQATLKGFSDDFRVCGGDAHIRDSY